MKEISAFDVIGPIMVGPSSSHTAGALRIALMINRIANSKVVKVDSTLYGSFAATYQGHGTDRAIIGGVLGFETFDPRVKDSLEIATSEGIAYTFTPDFTTETDHPNTVMIRAVTCEGQEISIIGESIGGGAIRIININDMEVQFTGAYHTLIIEQRDVPGVVSNITAKISEEGINIAFMRVFREEKRGQAFTIIETDEEIHGEIVAKLLELPAVEDVSIIRMGD